MPRSEISDAAIAASIVLLAEVEKTIGTNPASAFSAAPAVKRGALLFFDRADDTEDFNRAKDHTENGNGSESIDDDEPRHL